VALNPGSLNRGAISVGFFERLRRECRLCGAAELKTISTFNLREDQEKYGQGGFPE
jgi:hypothetical protein